VTQPPQLGGITFTGVKKKHRDDLQKKIPLLQGSRIRPNDLERSEQLIEEFYHEKGFLLAEVDIQQEELSEDRTNLIFHVDRGKKVKVSEIIVSGNDAFSNRKVRKQMKTNTKSWWRFWKKKTFDEDKFEDDLDAIVQFYNDKGYYDARIVHDSAYVVRRGDEGDVVVEVGVHEGPQYHIRNVEWEGNTLYPDALLSASLGLSKGDVYNASALEENLYANRRSSDITSLYLNRGYMRFNIQPTYRVVEGDSLDLHFDLVEGDIYEFGEINISGNTKTKEHVIRRELLTVPGQTFNRDAIQETIRRLAQLNYFEQESLGAGPSININESRKAVDLGFNFEETGSDQLELSGTFGRFGLVLLLGFTFNNFSVQDVFKKESWRPLPSGDGQRLTLRLQTNGRFFQSYTLGYTEPWFRGRPTPVGFNFEHSRFSRDPTLRGLTGTSTNNHQKFIRTSVSVFYD